MSWLCTHRDYISLDEAELERAAGACEIEAAARVGGDERESAFFFGAGRTLRILSCNDVTNYEDFLIYLNMEIETKSERGWE